MTDPSAPPESGEPTFPRPGVAAAGAPPTAPYPFEAPGTAAQVPYDSAPAPVAWSPNSNAWGPPDPPGYPGYPGAPGYAGYPGAPSYPSAPGHRGYPGPVSLSRSVTGLGIATQIMLAVQLLATVALLFPVLHEQTLIDRLRSNPRSVTLTEARHSDDTVAALSGVVTLVYLATGIVWIIWFYRARRNVEAWSPVFQRRSTGWSIGAWFCPIVNLWFPYVIAKDILDDTERREHGSRLARPGRPLLVLWWLSFAALFIIALVERSKSNAKTLDELTSYSDTLIVEIVVRVVGVVLAIVVVQQITAAQTKRRAQGLG
jgi:hypothetical protein